MLFDGDCAFCTWCVAWLRRRLVAPASFVPFQRVDPARFGLSRAEVEAFVWWIDPAGARWRGARAAARALARCRRPWPRVARALDSRWLAPFAELGYRLVSALRSWLPGVRPACRDEPACDDEKARDGAVPLPRRDEGAR